MSKTVQNVRQKIDALDNKIHDLLMERAQLVLKIGEEKRKNNIQVVQPDREAIMLRRLLERHQGPLPKEAIVRIWRELVGAVSLLQTGLKVVVTVPEDHTGLIYWDMAKDYFSSVLPMQKASNPLAALAMVREKEATFAVMTWPEDDAQNPWWSYLLEESGDDGMRIMARLPLGDRSEAEPTPEHRALVVARIKYETSNEDRSFLGFELQEEISRGRIVDKAKEVGLVALGLHTCPSNKPGRKFQLLEVDGYIDPQGEIQEKLLALLEDPDGKCVCLGGYPVPPVYADKVGKNAVTQETSEKKKLTA